MCKIQTKEEIQLRINKGKILLDNIRGKKVSIKDAKEVLELTKFGFNIFQQFLGSEKELLMVSMQECVQNNEFNEDAEEYENSVNLGIPLFFLVDSNVLLDY